MKNLAIICNVMRGELEKFKEEKPDHLDCVYLEQHLHDTPDIMREKLQTEIDKADKKYKDIILVYGLCSNGVVGLKSDTHRIIIPKVDDCISLFMGSREKYTEEFKKDPATYYLCKGWIEYGSDPYRAYLIWTGQEDKIPDDWFGDKKRYGKKYDEQTARILIYEMLKNYNRILLIDNNDLEKNHIDYAKDMKDFMDEILCKKIELVKIRGSSRMLKNIVDGTLDKSEFIIIEPGEKILQEHFRSNNF